MTASEQFFPLAVGVVAIAYLGCLWLTRSRFGRVLIAIRDDEDKAATLGYDVSAVKLAVAAIAGGLGALAGALYAPLAGTAHPSFFGIAFTIQAYVWVAIGGQGTLIGPIVAAVALKLLETGCAASRPTATSCCWPRSSCWSSSSCPRGSPGSSPRRQGQSGSGSRRRPRPLRCGSGRRRDRMAESPVVLQTNGLSRRFGGLRAVDGVNLQVRGGEVHCIIGPNGAGKSTLFNLISGMLSPSGGRVAFRDHDITGKPPHVISRLGLARSFQTPRVFPSLPVLDHALLASREKPRKCPLAREALARVELLDGPVSSAAIWRTAKRSAWNWQWRWRCGRH